MGLTTYEVLQTIYGISGTFKENPLTSDVNIAVTRIMPNNPNRLAFVLMNLSGNDIYISPKENVSSTNGIYISPSGGSIVMQWDKDLILPTLSWYATAGADSSSIYILEIVSV